MNFNYLIEYNSKIIGVFNTFNDAELFSLSCIQNNFMKNEFVKILVFHSNSCYCSEIKYITNFKKFNFININNNLSNSDNILNSDSNNIVNSDNILNSDFNNNDSDKNYPNNNNNKEEENIELEEFRHKKIELQHEINLINCEKRKLEEKKNIYESDLKLFNIFINKSSDEVPELFISKFNIMKKLNNENKLNFDNYYNNIYEEYEIDSD